MNAIIHFENHPHKAARFRDDSLVPALKRAGLEAEVIYIDYRDRTLAGKPAMNPKDVAAKAMRELDRLVPGYEKVAWVFDLDPLNATSPDVSYGLCVLQALVDFEFKTNVTSFCSTAHFLPAILTLYPDPLIQADGVARLTRSRCDLSSLKALWPNLTKVSNKTPDRNCPQEVQRAAQQALNVVPRIVFAVSTNDEWWLTELIVLWMGN